MTRVERAAWGTLAQSGQAALQRSIEERVADIRAAVKSKLYPDAQRRKLLLALDAIRSPGYVEDPGCGGVPCYPTEHGQPVSATR